MNKSKKIKQLKREIRALKAIVAKLSDDVVREDAHAEAHSWTAEPTLGELEAELQTLDPIQGADYEQSHEAKTDA
jgi:outer membrane murein-binding lipoprotein Lpp